MAGPITQAAKRPIGGTKRGGPRQTEVIQPRKPRNRAEEKSLALARQAEKVVELRRMRDDGELGVNMQIAQAFIVCCPLPYTRTAETKIVRTARMGDGSRVTVTLSAVTDAEMAFGSDRTLLYWLFDRAVKGKSRFVPLRFVSDYLRDMGMADSGKNRADVVDRLARVSGIFICVKRVDKLGKRELAMLPMFRSYRLPAAFEWDKNQVPFEFDPDEPMGIEFSEEFFRDLQGFHVPIPLEIVRTTRGKPYLQDHVNFIIWRTYIAQSGSLIPWVEVEAQCGNGSVNRRRLRSRFREAQRYLKAFNPRIQLEVSEAGLVIKPDLKGLE